jgi:hypothetical protein
MTEQLESCDSSRAVLIAMLPGPSRKRADALYQYRLTYRAPQSDTEGCLLLWQVVGGRQSYQVALERGDRGQLAWHCTCADHVYRGEVVPNHACKHIRGLRDFVPTIPASTPLSRAA